MPSILRLTLYDIINHFDMSDCIFCKIINKEIPADFIYEDEEFIAFNDINPKANTHILLLPKKHIDSLAELKESDNILMGKALYIAKKIMEEKGIPGYRVQINVGKSGGQEIFHIHFHLMSNH